MGGGDGVFSMGPGTLQIDRRAFHEPIRQGVVQRMQEKLPEAERGIAVLQVRLVVTSFREDLIQLC